MLNQREVEREALLTQYIKKHIEGEKVPIVVKTIPKKGETVANDTNVDEYITLEFFIEKYKKAWLTKSNYFHLLMIMYLMAEAVQKLHALSIVHLNLDTKAFLIKLKQGHDDVEEEKKWREDGCPTIERMKVPALKKIEDVKLTQLTHAHVLSKRRGRMNTVNIKPFHNIDYVSPEQTHKGHYVINQRADIYSLGAIYYNLLVGVIPFNEKSRDAIIDCHNYRNLTELRKHNSTIPIKLEQLVAVMMQKSPQERPDSMNVVLNTLKQTFHAEAIEFPDCISPEPIVIDEEPMFIIDTGLSIGRSSTLKLLERTFDRTRNGLPIFSLFRGSSGNGKQAMFENLAAQYQYTATFVNGSFAKRLLPFSPLIHVAKQLLAKMNVMHSDIKKAYLDSLRESMKGYESVLCEYMPELEDFLELQPHQQGVALESRTYHHEQSSLLQTSLVNFFTAFCSGSLRLVIYMSNIENAGNFSLSVLEMLLTRRSNLLFIGSTNSQNTESYDTPIGNLLSRLKKRNSRVNKLEIDTFPRKHIQSFVTSVLHGTDHRKLSDLIHSKSSGKAITVQEILIYLYDLQLLQYNCSSRSYEYDYDKVAASLPKLSSKIAEHYIQLNLKTLLDAQPILASIFNMMAIFSRPMAMSELMLFMDEDEADVFDALMVGMQSGVIDSVMGVYSFTTSLMERCINETLKKSNINETYALIAQTLVQVTPPESLNSGFTVYEIIKYYKKLLPSLDEATKKVFIQMSFLAGTNILKTKLPKTAQSFIDVALKLVDDAIKESIPETVFRLKALWLRIQMMNSSRNMMDECDKLLIQATNATQKLHVLELMVIASNKQHLYEKTFLTIHQIFEEKQQALQEDTLASQVALLSSSLRTSIDQMEDIQSFLYSKASTPLVEDDFYFVSVLCEAESISWFVNDASHHFYIFLGLTALSLVFKNHMHHASAAIALGYGAHAFTMLGFPKVAFRLVEAGYALALQLGTPRIESKLLRFRSLVSLYAGEHMSSIRKDFKKGFTFAVETHDMPFITGFMEIAMYVCLGFHLTDIKLIFRRVNNRVPKNSSMANVLRDALVASTFHLKLLKDADASLDFSPKYASSSFLSSRLGRFLHPFFAAFSQLFVEKGEFEAYRSIEQASVHLNDFLGTPFSIVFPLLRATIYGKCFDADPSQRPHFLSALASLITPVDSSTPSLSLAIHHYCVAEHKRCSSGHVIEILQSYQEAISIAETFHFKLLIGFASSRLVDLLTSLRFYTPLVVTTLRVALSAFKEVGATRTIESLRLKHASIYDYCDSHTDSSISPIVILRDETITPSLSTSDKLPSISSLPLSYQKQLSLCSIDLSNSSSLSGVSKHVTLLACSIRNFGKLIVHKSPTDVFSFMNNFFSRISPVLLKYNGYVHTIHGSMFIAVFPDSEQDAAFASIFINESLNEYNKERLSFGESFPVRVGISLHRESACFGLLRFDDHFMNHLVFSSMDKLTKMMELTNPFGISIMASHKIVKSLEAADALNFRFIGKFVLDAERDTPLQVYELYNPDWIQYKGNSFKEFDRALHMFYEKKFIAATNVFVRVAKGAYSSSGLPDHLARIYVKVCRMYKHLPLPSSWNGEVIVSPDGSISPFGGKRSSFYLQQGISQFFFNDELSSSDVLHSDSSSSNRSKDDEIAELKASLASKSEEFSQLKASLQHRSDQASSYKKKLDSLSSSLESSSSSSKKYASLLEKERRKNQLLSRRLSQLSSNRGLFSCFSSRHRPTHPSSLRHPSSKVTPVDHSSS